MVLTGVSQRMHAESDLAFEMRLPDALAGACLEHGITFEDMGLAMSCRYRKGFWVGRRKINTPTWHCVDTAVAAMRRLSPYHTQVGHGKGSAHTLLKNSGPAELRLTWEQFKSKYLDICEESGWQRDLVAAQLKQFEAAAEQQRERALERWNLNAMRHEERISRHNLHMQFGRRTVRDDESLEAEICGVLDRWQRLEVRRRDNMARAAHRAEKIAQREAQLRAKRSKLARKPFKDLTMDEILGDRNPLT